MKNLKKEVGSLPVRTPFQRTIKKAVLSLLEGAGFVELKDPVDRNNKDVLVEFARENDIEVPDPQHKPDYVKAIEKFLSDGS